MDKIHPVITDKYTKELNQVKESLSPGFLWIILGPTASGKTKLAVDLAKKIKGEVISVDSRQIYRGMNIGTGKDLVEYDTIPYHLIDILEPGEKYNLSLFQQDFEKAYTSIRNNNSEAIAVGGTGLYLHSLLVNQPYINIPKNDTTRDYLKDFSLPELIKQAHTYKIPPDFNIDFSTHKRTIRAIEILEYLSTTNQTLAKTKTYPSLVFGINPLVEDRRNKISDRLKKRVEEGLIDEVITLIDNGTSHQDLQYYGLEYKYASLFLLGELDKQSFLTKLETEIHRYAKRQMTFFRKMEKDGVKINWLRSETLKEQTQEIIHISKQG